MSDLTGAGGVIPNQWKIWSTSRMTFPGKLFSSETLCLYRRSLRFTSAIVRKWIRGLIRYVPRLFRRTPRVVCLAIVAGEIERLTGEISFARRFSIELLLIHFQQSDNL